jgi:glycosyltransferase involved in cell wall biosynthesis
MKILHYNVFKDVPIGVRNQLLDEEKAVGQINEGLEWDIAVSCMCDWDVSFRTAIRPGTGSGLLTDIQFYKDAYRWLKDVAPGYDKILVRYRTANPWQAKILRSLENVYTVHHAVEELESVSGDGAKPVIERWIEKMVGPYALKSVDGIIALTPEILAYETGRALPDVFGSVYPNGICLRDITAVPDRREGNLKYLFAGSVAAPWHGLDRAVGAMLAVDPDAEIHVAGPQVDVPYGSSGQVVFHGELTRAGLSQVAGICDAGLGTFALGKKGMQQACTLKVREYLAFGLPVVSGAIDSGFSAEFPYYIKITNALDWEVAIERVRQWRQVSRNEVRGVSSAFIDKQLIMKRLLNELSLPS